MKHACTIIKLFAGNCSHCSAHIDGNAHVRDKPKLTVWCAACCCGLRLFDELPAEAFVEAAKPAKQEGLF